MYMSLYHLFLYATIILSVLTVLGALFYLKDRKRRLSESSVHMEMTPAEQIGEIDAQIAALKQRIARLEEEKHALFSRAPKE